MASYNGLAENINKTRLDNQKILKDLKKLETTIKYLKSFPPSELSEEIKMKIHLLVTSSQVLQARLFRSAVESKTLDELWEGNGMLKYLFESNIKHYSVNNQLKCLICDEWLPASREQLKNHLEGSSHIQRYLDTIQGETMSYWKDTISLFSSTSGEMGEELSLDNDRCLMLKYGKFIDFNGPNDMLFCKLCCTTIPKNNNCLQAHFKESLHQELFKDVVNAIVGRTKNNLDKTKNKNIFTDSEPDSLTLMSFKNVQNGELATGTSIQPINQNRADMESWFKDTIDKFIVEFLEDGSPNDKLYICSICQVHTSSYKRWQEHCFSVSHETRMILSSNVSYYPCQCSTEMICPNYIREYHMNKNHDRLLKLFNSLKLKQVRFDVSDDDDATSDEDNNNRRSILESKFNNSVKNLGAKPKMLNVHNGVDKRNNPSAKKQVKKIDENDTTCADTGDATPIGLSDIPDNASDDDLIREIQHFGSIKEIERVKPSFANVYIELREEFQSIVYLGLTITVKGTVVSVTDPILQSNTDSGANDARNKHVVDAQIPISMSTKFQEESPFRSMVLELMARSEINDALSPIIKHHLKESLSLTGQVIIVGSQALKLTFDKSSTMDFFVEIDDNYFGKKTELTAVELSTRTIRLFDLLKQSKHFKNVEIVGDNVQVLTLVYSDTDRKCQIFFRDGLVVEKTNLSLIYLNCDKNIGEMVVSILEWFKEIGLRNALPTYSILWLALFPLITKHYLCPVVILRNNNDAGRKMISGWDCRYSASFSPKTAALPSAYVLVRKFFEFYSDARNFDKKVLAPLTGEIFDHQRVRQKKLPPPYSRYSHLIATKSVRFFKLSSGICLQDPLQLNYNLTLPLQGKNLNKFVASCKSTLQCFNQ